MHIGERENCPPLAQIHFIPHSSLDIPAAGNQVSLNFKLNLRRNLKMHSGEKFNCPPLAQFHFIPHSLQRQEIIFIWNFKDKFENAPLRKV